MTLTLTDEEVVVYMTMKQHIVDLDNYIIDIKQSLAAAEEYIEYLELNRLTTTLKEEVILPTQEDISNFLYTPSKGGSHWSTEEKEALSNIRDKSGIYNNMHIESIMNFFPNRTKASVVSALWTKNIGVVKSRLKFKIVPSKIKGES